MATISTSQFLDNGTARTAGEAWTINSGAELTIRTDSRVHANAPASMTGSFGSMTITEGKIIIDAQNVRWLAYNTGAGNVPAIGTTITQGGVSGYLLGVWASLTSAPTAVGVAMPTTGFIKFREVTGGTFTAGALTGIGASATGADVLGWMEIVGDESMNVTVPRLGEFRTRGGYFGLGTTNGSVAQVIQIPTNGGGSTTHVAGVSVETASGSGVYEDYPSLNGALTNGWARQHLGTPVGGGDSRQKFVKGLGSGQFQFGEAVALAGTYASLAAQAGTYASISLSMTYTWASDIVECYISTGHGLVTGQQTGLDFTSGGATADGIYTVTVLDGYRFTVPLTGSGTAGNVTARPGVLVTFTGHGLNIGESTYCDFTTGTGVDGTYEVYGVPTANTYQIKYPHTTALTSGNVSCTHTLVITFTSHLLTVGNQVTLDFTTGTGVDGTYTIKATAANTFNVNWAHTPTTSGNVTINMTIGYVPPTGCNIRVPNIFFRNTTAAARQNNVVPNATFGTRPEFITTSAGAIDIEYGNFDWYCQFAQAYSVRMRNVFVHDALWISECATALDIDQCTIGMYGAIDTPSVYLLSNFAGGTLANIKAERGNAPGVADHAFFLQNCIGQTLSNCRAGIIQNARSSGYPFQISNCQNITVNNCVGINSMIVVSSSFNITINDYDHVDKYLGYTNTAAGYIATINGSSQNVVIDGFTIGLNGTIPSVHPYTGLFSITSSTGIKIRNGGTLASPLATYSWAGNLTASAGMYVSSGNNFDVKFQRIYGTGYRSYIVSTANSDKQMVYESCGSQIPFVTSTMGLLLNQFADLEGQYKGMYLPPNTTGQVSVYGSHFNDAFEGSSYGRLQLMLNEPTTTTSSQFTMVSGTAKYNSSGAIIMPTIGNQAIWEDNVFRKGHTAFANITPTMTSGTIGNYTMEYQIDTGSGYGGTWKTLNTTNLTAETLDPAVGFKLKLRITVATTNTSAFTAVTIYTRTSTVAQGNLYPLDTINLTLTGLISGSDVVIYEAGTTTVLAQQEDNSGTTYQYTYETLQDIDIGVFLSGYIPYYIRGYTLTSSNASLPISQVVDRAYLT